jgi:hypothetical protein
MTTLKSSHNGITIVFPDVCKIPAPPAPFAPIPYPNIAKTATARINAAKPQTATVHKAGPPLRSQGDEAGTLKGMIASGRQTLAGPGTGGTPVPNTLAEVQQLRSRMTSAHQQLIALPAGDPDKWQSLLQEYAVSASALYVTLLPA